MILAFDQRFKQPILDGIKIHTIREDKPNRWKEGMPIHMATGVRTKKYDCFMTKKCTGVQPIEIYAPTEYIHNRIVKINGRKLAETEVKQFLLHDGFDSLLDFWLWLDHRMNIGTFYSGKIIHWTEFRY